jgi:hypothetical protein
MVRGGGGGESTRCGRLIILTLSCACCLEIWEAQIPGSLRGCPGLYRDCFALHHNTNEGYFSL